MLIWCKSFISIRHTGQISIPLISVFIRPNMKYQARYSVSYLNLILDPVLAGYRLHPYIKTITRNKKNSYYLHNWLKYPDIKPKTLIIEFVFPFCLGFWNLWYGSVLFYGLDPKSVHPVLDPESVHPILDPESLHLYWIRNRYTCTGSGIGSPVLDPESVHLYWIRNRFTLYCIRNRYTCTGSGIVTPVLGSESLHLY